MARPLFSAGRYRLQYKRPSLKRVWSGLYRQVVLTPPCRTVDLLRSLGSIKIKVLSIYTFTRVLIRPGLKHDLNKSTPPVGTELSEQLAYTNRTRPFFGWALILQAITPSAKKEVWPRETRLQLCKKEYI